MGYSLLYVQQSLLYEGKTVEEERILVTPINNYHVDQKVLSKGL